jgi:peroxiredoxin
MVYTMNMLSAIQLQHHVPHIRLQGFFENKIEQEYILSNYQEETIIVFFPGAYTTESEILKEFLNNTRKHIVCISTDSQNVIQHYFKDMSFRGWILSDNHHAISIDFNCFDDISGHSQPGYFKINAQHELVEYYIGTMSTIVKIIE